MNKQDAEPAEASWYLSRDGEQHGPLSDRELSLFAEGGNFKPGDLLWTAGLDEWKPADSIFGLAPSADDAEPALDDTEFVPDADEDAGLEDDSPSEASAPYSHESADTAIGHHDGFDDDSLFDDPLAGDPLDEHVGALAKALSGETEPPKLSFQEKLTADIKSFGGFCAYLWSVFVLLTMHALVGGAEYGVGMSFFVLSTVNAFLLMQAMPLVERFGFFQDLKHKPLVYSVAVKTLIFVAALVLAYEVEMGLLGFVGVGAGFMSLGGGLGGTLAWCLVFSIALLPYFALREIEAAVGADMIRKLLFRRH